MPSQTIEELDAALWKLSDEYPSFTTAHRQVLNGVEPAIVKEALIGVKRLGDRNRWLLALLVRDCWPHHELRSVAQRMIQNFFNHPE